MKFGTVLVASLLALGMTACSSKWPPQVRQEALENCVLQTGMSISMSTFPPDPIGSAQKADRICVCAVEKAEKANSSAPKTSSEADRMVSPHIGSCR